MLGAFQQYAGANPIPTSRGFPLECLEALDGKEFNGVRGVNLAKAKYWLEGVEKIFKQIPITTAK
ncbi:hypothetical protein J1N35_010043 [Gossypium stocksii]|uniref:Uncharacterized protein n=1 Tax=Gossypium stocksii TaxID=47602 RepID=A0A9D4AC83_9ROSI|nr:hypothetical protein J1N35_010043 [Gossypium stocksii]